MNNATYPAKITGLRRQHLFFALCWTAYFSTYIGRLNFTASLAAISAAASIPRAFNHVNKERSTSAARKGRLRGF